MTRRTPRPPRTGFLGLSAEGRAAGPGAVGAWGMCLTLLTGCQLTEISMVRPEGHLVGEAYVMVGDGDDQVTVFLHETLGTKDPAVLASATVKIRVGQALELFLEPQFPEICLMPEAAEKVRGSCFAAGPEVDGLIQPGDRVEVEISLRDGRSLRGTTVLPGELKLLQPRNAPLCALPPGRHLPMVWSRSAGAWAYSAESSIWGLRGALAGRGIEVEKDSVALQGLAVSEKDTVIVFPREFGVFSRAQLQRELALALQEGLPRGAAAVVTLAALDRNYVNWVRGGNFNPSGLVRVPSLRGDGTGVVASAVRRTLGVVGSEPRFIPGALLPPCIVGG